uniref:FBA_2 domain-containing protein n=1 Tax=Caenorhabditis tropicalis TaxID=1561998 RepID=A0A1I7TIR5_9PELO
MVVDDLVVSKVYPHPIDNKFYESIQVRNSLTFDFISFMDPESPVFSINHICFHGSKWVTKDHLLKFRGRSIAIQGADSIRTDEVIEFIDNWLNGSNTKLEFMCIISHKKPSIVFNKKEIVERFNVFPWDPKKRGARFNCIQTMGMSSLIDPLDCTQGMDIERKSDGMLATIMMEDFHFRFYL